MSTTNLFRAVVSAIVGSGLMLFAPGQADPQNSQPPKKITPKLVPIAETQLLMNGLAHANFRGLERILKQKPAEDQAWKFARGQALLIAETGNLLMLRPPHNAGEPIWFDKAMSLRDAASELAQTAARKDFEACRANLQNVANRCNSCHQSFKVKVQISVFQDNMP
jgi:hypothetical protein